MVNPETSSTKLQVLLANPSSGTTSNISSGATYPYGGLYLIRADVAGSSGQGTATGNVVFTDSGRPLDGSTFRLNSTSDTEDQTAALAPGVHSFAAAYSGDASFTPSQSSPVLLTISKALTSSSLTADAASVSDGATVTLTAKINPQGVGNSGFNSYGAYAPSGIVTFQSGSTKLGTATVTQNAYPAFTFDSASAVFTFPASLLAVGINNISVSYAGDSNYSPSDSGAISINVVASVLASSATAVALSAPTVAPGAPYTFTAQVIPTSPYASGTVQFTSDGQTIGKPVFLMSGQASLSNSDISLTAGTHMIAAVYSGDANYKSSASAPVTFAITVPTLPSSMTVSVSPSTVVQGGAVTVTSVINPGSATGTEQLVLDGGIYGQPIKITGASNSLPLDTTTLESGSHVLQVAYSGDTTYLPSISPGTTLNILASVGTFTFATSNSSTTVAHGGTSAPVMLTAIPLDGFHSTITFACTGGLPGGATCSFAPANVTPTGPAALTTSLVVTMSAANGPVSDRNRPARSSWFPLTSGIAICGLFLVALPRRYGRRPAIFLLVVFAAFASVTGCGSGTAPSSSNSGANSAPGTYAVTVTATGGSTIQTATFNLVVK